MATTAFAMLVFLGFLTLLLLVPAIGGAGGITIHDVLQAHGLPAGLFPKKVESYTLDPITGMLEVRLNRTCYADYPNYNSLAKFERLVRGNLSYGEIRSVEGLSQQELFIWLPVKDIVSYPSSGLIIFDIVYAHKQLARSPFEVPPECRPAKESLIGLVSGGLSGRKIG